MKVEQGVVKFKAGIFSSCEIGKYFICHTQKIILKAMKKDKPQNDMVRFAF